MNCQEIHNVQVNDLMMSQMIKLNYILLQVNINRYHLYGTVFYVVVTVRLYATWAPYRRKFEDKLLIPCTSFHTVYISKFNVRIEKKIVLTATC